MNMQRAAILLLSLLAIPFVLFQGRRNGNLSNTTALSVVPSPKGWVQVEGDVEHPGIQPISDNILTTSVIKLAKPVCTINGQEPIRPGSHTAKTGDRYTIICKNNNSTGELSISEMQPKTCILLGIPFSINTASADDFEALPEIGPAIAKRIFVYRQKNGGFKSIEELLMIEGIGEKKYAKIKNKIKL